MAGLGRWVVNRSRSWSWLAGLLKWIAVGLLLGVPAVLAWLQVVGVDAELRERVAAALSSPVIRVEIGRLRFSVFDGVLAEGVRIYRREPEERILASVDGLALALNLASLLRGEIEVDALRIENGAAEIPFADDGIKPDAVQLVGIETDVKILPGQLFISNAECRLGKLRLKLRGRILNPEAVKLPEPAETEGQSAGASVIRRVISTFNEIDFAGEPVIEIDVAGDLKDLNSLRAEKVKLRMGGVRFRKFDFDSISADGHYADGEARVASLSIRGPSANLTGAGGWRGDSGTGEFSLGGSVDPVPILAEMGDGAGVPDLTFRAQPSLNASVQLWRTHGKFGWKSVGKFESGAFRMKEVEADQLTGNFSTDGERLFLQDLMLTLQTGTIRADLLRDQEGEFHLRAEVDAVPTELLSLMGPKEREIVGRMDFAETPHVSIAMSGPDLKFKSMTGGGKIRLGRTAMRDVWIDEATADLVLEDLAVRYENFVVRKGEGRGTGGFTYDFGRQLVRLENIVSAGLDPPSVLMWINPKIAETVAAYRFNRPPNAELDGVIYMGDPEANDLHIKVDAPSGMSYALLQHDLEFGPTQGRVQIKGRRVLADVDRASIYGGAARVAASVSTDRSDPGFSVEITLDGVDFPKLTNLYFGYDRSQGKLSGTYRFDASLRSPSSMVGRGQIRVEDGHVLDIPLFGPLSNVLDSIIPGTGHESAKLATVDFSVARGMITTENLEIVGEGFEMAGEGSVGFPSGKLDLAMRINARGLPGIVLFPVSKLFEYESNGTVSDPGWKPKIVPKEFWQVLDFRGDGEASDSTSGSGRVNGTNSKEVESGSLPGRPRGAGRKR